MIVIGLTGSIAMGKTEVSAVFRGLGIPVFDADKEVHALYDSAEGADLLRPFAPEAVAANAVDRAELSALVLSDAGLLEKLEPIVHAEVAKRRKRFLAQARAQGHDLAVVDVPLLFEKAGEKDVDVTLVVSAPPHLQRERALARPGMTEEKLGMILKRQMPDAEKRVRADYVLENDGSLEELRARTLAILDGIRRKKHT
jgi:dephospho-CoA kinase